MGRGTEDDTIALQNRDTYKTKVLPIDLDSLPFAVKEDILQASEAALLMEPLARGEESIKSRRGSETLPATSPRLIGISGRPRAGKDAIAEGILSRYKDVDRINFSDMIIDEVNAWLKGTGHRITEDNKSDARYRHLLQAWGMARRAESKTYWTDSVKKRVRDLWNEGSRLVLVCGVRAVSDLEAIEDLGGEHWRVVRPANEYSAEHAIEKQLDDLPAERQTVIENDSEGDLASLHGKVYDLLS
jgi:hypothetical protein